MLLFHKDHTVTLRSGNLALQVPFTATRQYLSAKVHILFGIENMMKEKMWKSSSMIEFDDRMKLRR